MSLFWKVLETVDYTVLRLTGRLPKKSPAVAAAQRAEGSKSTVETPASTPESGALDAHAPS